MPPLPTPQRPHLISSRRHPPPAPRRLRSGLRRCFRPQFPVHAHTPRPADVGAGGPSQTRTPGFHQSVTSNVGFRATTPIPRQFCQIFCVLHRTRRFCSIPNRRSLSSALTASSTRHAIPSLPVRNQPPAIITSPCRSGRSTSSSRIAPVAVTW